MPSSFEAAPPPRRRSWLAPAVFAVILFFGGVSGNLVAAYIQPSLEPYRRWVWLAFGIAMVVTVMAAIRDYRQSNDPPTQQSIVNASGPGAVAIGNSATGAPIITGVVGRDVVLGDQHIHESPVPTVSALHQLPPPPPAFTGREKEMNDLRRHLTNGITISGVQGMGGVGKTALALKLAEQIKDRYPDAQFYLDLKGVSARPLAAADAMRRIIYAYHPKAPLPDDADQLAAVYRSVLHGQRALLLMDNAKDADQVAPLVPPSSCVMLVTSRYHFAIQGLHSIDLSSMTPEDARALLVKIAPRIGADAGKLAELCGYLPLALELAANALKVKINISPAEYTRRLTDARLKVLDKVEASINLSYELLGEELQRRWRALSVFPDTFDEAAAVAVWELEGGVAQEALSELLAFSLVEWNKTTARYRLHDLARVFADSRLSEAERLEHQQRHAEHYQKVSREANNLYQQGGEDLKQGLALFDLEWVNIQTGQSWAKRNATEIGRALELSDEYPAQCYNILPLRQHPREQIEWLETARMAANKLGRKQAEGWHLGNLGNAYYSLGEVRKAIEYHEGHLKIAREIGDRQGEGAALGNLGNAYYSLGEVRKAIEYYEQALVIDREIGDRRGEGAALGNLGLAYADLGEVRKAIEYYEQRFEIAREIGDRRGEGNVLGNLGVAYYSLGEVRKAIEHYEGHLKIAREIGDRGGEGNALGNLGIAYKDLGEVRKAIEHYEGHLKIAREIGDRRGEGNALGNLGVAYYSLGEVRKAIEYYEQALVIDREIGDRRGEGADLGNLGLAYADLGEVRKAIEYYEQALVIDREIGDRRGEGNVRWNTALAWESLGDRAQALANAETALLLYEQIEDPTAARVRERLEEWRGE